MNFWKRLFAPVASLLRHPVDSFIKLETSDDAQTLVASDGSLVTYIKVDGARQIIGDEEYEHIVKNAALNMGSRFDRPGYAMQVYFSRNPEAMRREIGPFVKPNRTASHNIKLELDDLFEEKERHLSRYLSWEEMYFVIWTRPGCLTKVDIDRGLQELQSRKWVNARGSQNPHMVFDLLRGKHKSFVTSIETVLEELGVQAKVLNVHDALRAVRNNLYPNQTSHQWQPNLPGDKIVPRAPERDGDYSDLLWPSIKTQLASDNAETVTRSVVRIGDQLWGGVDMTLGPSDTVPFPTLLNRMVEAKMPFRISFLIESGGIQGAATQRMLSSILAFTNGVNKQVKSSLEQLVEVARNEAVVKMRISAATWAPEGELKLVQERMSSLIQSMESWGYAQVSNMRGDPLSCVMSSAMGIHCASTAPAAVLPLQEAVRLFPWQRPSSPFEEGAVLFRTPDGRIWPYQTGSTLTTTWFDLIFAQPGAGKSVLMNTLNFGTCLTAGQSKLPFIAIIDIGPSSAGLISMLQDALPKERRYEVGHYKLRMSPEYAVNPFDTQLGCRYPLPEERSFLMELMTLLCTPAGQERPYDGISQLVGLVVDEMYRWRDDSQASSEARAYLERLDDRVDEAISKYNLRLPDQPTWWDVVDVFYEAELFHEVTLAQRHAVPTLQDCITAARRPQIRALLEETQIGSSSENVISAFERMMTSAVREFPILASVTKFDLGSVRVCALDLQDVCPQGDDTADRQTAIMYMLARYALVRSWMIGPESLQNIPTKYHPYHKERIKDIKETPKRISYDEFHRTSKSQSVRSQIVRDVREGRKWGVQIVLASQLLEDFDDNMVDLATGVWILGAAVSDGAVDNAQKRFGLSNTARWIMRNRLTGPRSTGAPALFVLGSNEGRYEQHLINTLGPIELWAFSTSAEDVAIRSRLYERIGAGTARRMLAATFPGGSARGEIRRRINMRSETGDDDGAATFAIVEEIVEELVQAAQNKRLEQSLR